MHFFVFVLALFATLVAIPPLMGLAGRLRLVDEPGARKLHTTAIPRCGGIAIALATLVPVVMWAPLDRLLWGYVLGALIVLAFGVVDDLRPLDYRWKLLGQFAAIAVAMAAGIRIEQVPFFGLDPAPAWVSYPLTLLFLLGITNAVNLFDGLDGLAGGCVMLSLAAIAVLAHQGDGRGVVLIAVAAAGGIFGFLRYNTHPASVFMGDGGSQFLGFTAAVLAVLLVQVCHPALNPGIILFLLGLPILDTLMVMTERMLAGRSPFAADRNHLHHKLLALQFKHYEAVSLIYGVQGVMVGSAFLLLYQSDGPVLGAFVLVSALVLAPILWARAKGWQVRPADDAGLPVERRNLWLRRRSWLPAASMALVRWGVVAFLLGATLVPVVLSPDLSVLTLSVSGLAVAVVLVLRSRGTTMLRVTVYVASAIAAYQVAAWQSALPALAWPIGAYLAALALALALAIRVTRRELFRVTPQDLLVLFLVLAVPNLSGELFAGFHLGKVALILVVLFYAAEFVLSRDERGRTLVRLASLASLCIIGMRGLLAQ